MEQFTSDVEGIRRKKAMYGPLSFTAEDHLIMGSTPDDTLRLNPKTPRAALMSDQEIESWLAEQIDGMKVFEGKTDSFSMNYLPQLRQSIRASLVYLQEIGRLPRRFASYSVS